MTAQEPVPVRYLEPAWSERCDAYEIWGGSIGSSQGPSRVIVGNPIRGPDVLWANTADTAGVADLDYGQPDSSLFIAPATARPQQPVDPAALFECGGQRYL
jgi:hypothetical protein